MLNIGDLNQRCTYYMKGASISDGVGGYTVTDGTAVTTWCSAQPMPFKEVLRYGLADGDAPVYFAFYYEQGKNLFQGSKIVFESVEYRVKSVVEKDKGKDTVIIFGVKKV